MRNFMRDGDIAEILFHMYIYINIYEYKQIIQSHKNEEFKYSPEVFMKILVERAIFLSGMEERFVGLDQEENTSLMNQAMQMAKVTDHYYKLNEEFIELIGKRSA